ncbi:hypothetical protein BOW35_09605 [Solemya velum gill symbiont]|nr:hypothetical protein BOW27_08780 [Solemya velum gill symbiont]OOZ19132.1 hypothetical protein BOW29_08690 [Solemya velum gill symbiont]OOZ21546.1 hypothetical protein BOW30_09290 [Solemya velum gill symbiont]OOZ23607.1 hypothetical protein BOW31_09335 [Solemya velum gill symbiont]OOZ28665.1 hypothetical protein BOW33_09160 [Solemya velum gill symbiont]
MRGRLISVNRFQQQVVIDLLASSQGDEGFTLSVSDSCMEPIIRDGDQLEVVRCPCYYPGDLLVIANAEGKLVSHRFLGWIPGVNGARVMTRADNRHKIDPLTDAHRVLGRVVGVAGFDLSIPLSHRLFSMLRYGFYSVQLPARKLLSFTSLQG